MASNRPKVLITGASGLIGGLTWRNLGHKYKFSGLNRMAVPEIPNTQADISDFDAILPAFKGIDMGRPHGELHEGRAFVGQAPPDGDHRHAQRV